MKTATLVLLSALALAGCEKEKAAPAPVPASKEEAESCYQRRDFVCAEQNLRGYLSFYPTETRSRALLALTLTKAGKHHSALEHYKRAIDEGMGTYDLFANYAISLDAAGQLDEAIKWNRKSLEVVPGLVDVRGSLAQQLVKQGKYQEAIDLLQSFDAYLKKNGESAYFTAQILVIKERAAAAKAAKP